MTFEVNSDIILLVKRMKIIYKQSGNNHYGIQNCCLKQIFPERDNKVITGKTHRHRGYEIHITESGSQCYESGGRKYNIENGHFLMIVPGEEHKVLEYVPHTERISLSFTSDVNVDSSCFGKLSRRMQDNICFILEENKKRKFFSNHLIESRAMELIILILREAGMNEDAEQKNSFGEDARMTLARQYIMDNAEQNIKVSDIAGYCYLSTKQLTRLFLKYEGVSPALYIQKQKVLCIEKLLENKNLSLRDISEKMNFSSEYYFNAFFKKNYGMPPGVYRDTMK